jgi:hypothetical protein
MCKACWTLNVILIVAGMAYKCIIAGTSAPGSAVSGSAVSE